MAMSTWTFEVTESFRLTGRGVGLFGRLEGTVARSGQPADLTVERTTTRVDRVNVEWARRRGGEDLVLFLVGWADLVPAGSVLSGPVG